jgi:hypothetical protein
MQLLQPMPGLGHVQLLERGLSLSRIPLALPELRQLPVRVLPVLVPALRRARAMRAAILIGAVAAGSAGALSSWSP